MGIPALKAALCANGAGVPEFEEGGPTAAARIAMTIDRVVDLIRESVAEPPVAAPAPVHIDNEIEPSDILSLVARRRSTASVATNAILKRVADGFAIDAKAIPAVIEALCKGFETFSDASIAHALQRSASHVGVSLDSLTQQVAEHRAQQRAALAVAAATPVVESAGLLSQLHAFVNEDDRLRWNELTNQIEHDGEPWTDDTSTQLRLLLERRGISDPDRPLAIDTLERAVRLAARKRSYHPVREYLESLPAWDGVARLETLFATYLKCEDSALNRELGLCFGIAAVARLYQPGCKHDLMPILYGSQGGRKSTAIRVLAGGEPAYSDAKLNVAHKNDAYMALHECWIYECGELHGLDRADQNMIKALVSQTEDRYCPPYGRNRVREPRAGIMIGTTNQEECLRDPTGNRRFPVIRCLATQQDPIDTNRLSHDRDLLWAEALHRYRAGEQWWLREAAAAELESSNERHMQSDTWQERVVAWLEVPTVRVVGGTGYEPGRWPSDTVSSGELLEHALGISIDRQGKGEQTRIGIVARALRLEVRWKGSSRRYAIPGYTPPTP